jgi:hypothetical protein
MRKNNIQINCHPVIIVFLFEAKYIYHSLTLANLIYRTKNLVYIIHYAYSWITACISIAFASCYLDVHKDLLVVRDLFNIVY